MSEQDISAEVEELRQQLARHAAEANSVCQEWDVKCQGLEAEAAELRKRLVGAHQVEDILRGQLATVTDLVPSAGLLERAAEMMWHTCESCPTLKVRCPGYRGDRANGLCNTLTKELMELAARIRAWRGDGGGGEEQREGSKDKA